MRPATAMRPAAGPFADLHDDLLDQIFGVLPSFVDRICCTGVCKEWRRIVMQRDNTAPLMLPWLLRPSTAGATYYHFFNRTEDAEPAVLQRARGARFVSAIPGGWFVVARGQWSGYALLNLVTGEEDRLPDGLPGAGEGDAADELLIVAATRSPELSPDGRFLVAAITLGRHKAVYWSPGMDRWEPVVPDGDGALESEERKRIMLEELEEFEDVIYYHCDHHEGFYFLTSQERLLVYDAGFDEDNDGGPTVEYDLELYPFEGHQMSVPPGAEQTVAGRYLVESSGRLFMVKRFASPGHGTVSFQVFRLEWGDESQPYWEPELALMGTLLFIGRGCSRSFQTGIPRPGHIYFLDDAERFRDADAWLVARTERMYRCSDAGWCSYVLQYVKKNWPEGPHPPDCSPWIWRYR